MSSRKLAAILLGIVVLAGAAWAALQLTHTKSTQVVVTLNGEQAAVFDLHTDRTVVLQPKDGSWYNTLTIQNGIAAITESDCDNQICVHTPALQEGQAGLIVCLPHGLVLELQ